MITSTWRSISRSGRWALSWRLWFSSLLLSFPAGATPQVIKFQNVDPVRTAAKLSVCVPVLGCTVYPITCGPGEICSVIADIPPGSAMPVWAQIATVDSPWSGDSNTLVYQIIPVGVCDYDFDFNKSITVSDFAVFLKFFEKGYATAADFGPFLQAFGKNCP